MNKKASIGWFLWSGMIVFVLLAGVFAVGLWKTGELQGLRDSLANLQSGTRDFTGLATSGNGEAYLNDYYSDEGVPTYDNYATWCGGSEDLEDAWDAGEFSVGGGRGMITYYVGRYDNASTTTHISYDINFYDTVVASSIPVVLTKFGAEKVYLDSGSGLSGFVQSRDASYVLSNDYYKGFVITPLCFPVDGGSYGYLQDAKGRGYPESVVSVLKRGSECESNYRIYAFKMGVLVYNDNDCARYSLSW